MLTTLEINLLGNGLINTHNSNDLRSECKTEEESYENKAKDKENKADGLQVTLENCQ